MATATSLDVALVQLMLVAMVGLMFYYMLQGIGQKSLCGLMKVALVLVVIAILAPALWNFMLEVQVKIEAFTQRWENIADKIIFWR